MVDGIAGVDLATVLLDLERTPPPPQRDLEPWRPHSEPSGADLVLAGARGFVGTGIHLAERTLQAAADPASTAGKLIEAAEGIGELVWAIRTPHRRRR